MVPYNHKVSNKHLALLQTILKKGRYKPMKKTTNINEVIKEIKEYQAMQDELKRQIEVLKAEAVEYLESNEIDEYTCDEGKVTYREVISNRLDTTALKKSEWSEVYDMFVKQTSSYRFTCN